jgi:transcriptional regulator with GAF, ATPase, and Fis domain
MNADHDLLDLSMLFDTARGFLAARAPEDRMRHALLSLVGALGARSAILLGRASEGVLVYRGARGTDGAEGAIVRISPEIEAALCEEPGIYGSGDLEGLGVEVAALARRNGSQVACPLVHEGRLRGLALLGGKVLGDDYSERDLELAAEVAHLAALALDLEPEAPQVAVRPRGRSAETLRREHPELRRILGDGSGTVALYQEILAVAPFDFPVLVVGETGTGKELVAQTLHELSPRATQPFEAVNCAAIPRDLVASALFGHEKGAFTGAVTSARGAFELAGGGTLFLDEIGDMPLDTQAALLRVLQEQRFRRVGGEKMQAARARVISATNIDLLEAVQEGRFRADLFYRLQMYVVRLSPLRERPEDLPALVDYVLGKHRPAGRKEPVPSDAFVAALGRRALPGNVRELEGLVLGAMVRARTSPVLEPQHLPEEAGGGAAVAGVSAAARRDTMPPAAASLAEGGLAPETVRSYENMERDYIRAVLSLTQGNKKRAAELMEIPRTTLNARIRKLGLESTA